MIQNLLGSVRQSLVFRTPDGGGVEGGSLVEKISSSIRKSRVGLFSRPALPPPPSPILKENVPQIRWRKGELIGCGAFGRVYMGMNLDSGELLAVKQVLITSNNASKDKAQAHIQELEEEVKLLKNLSHPNIVRYLGTAREEGTLNILLEFVPGGSISSLLGKFGSFPETVIRMYTKQLLLGLEYLHKNGIMHRDIKGANILVDNKGCIKLADFGASKQVVELATISGAKSMKGTPYWMAPEVILQTGHSFSADIWSVGCTIIEMATGKPPWSQQFQEVAALFHIGTTKSHPPIPEHLSVEAKDFLLKCLQKYVLISFSFFFVKFFPLVTCNDDCRCFCCSSINLAVRPRRTCSGLKDICDMRSSVRCSTIHPGKFSETGPVWRIRTSDDDMCQIDDTDDFLLGGSVNFSSALLSDDLKVLNKSFNPMCEPADDWQCKFDESSELEGRGMNLKSGETVNGVASSPGPSAEGENNFTFPSGPSVSEDDDEVTELKIRAFLDEKALDLKKLQSPLFEEFYNTLILSNSRGVLRNVHDENATNFLKLPPKSRSPSQVVGRTTMLPNDSVSTASPGSCSRRMSTVIGVNNKVLQEIPLPQPTEWRGLVDSQQQPISPSESFSERQRKWKEELDQELERKRVPTIYVINIGIYRQ
ncbi:Protein kinase domain [Macleaya cordata]|uniref:mitogen-activated protein kinase kinase kinase n=1 Tax=Macleaya cordata TaxID=56857 RepID=A0A200Q4S8_MACCD|nr:Protein kinase domain [Macleaya cordata]